MIANGSPELWLCDTTLKFHFQKIAGLKPQRNQHQFPLLVKKKKINKKEDQNLKTFYGEVLLEALSRSQFHPKEHNGERERVPQPWGSWVR